jgi:imidazolonepropionase-like amidohydrolase
MELNPEHTRPPETTNLLQRPDMDRRARAMVQAGITTARDLGGGAWLELGLRDDIAAGRIAGPRLLCAGQPITSPAGHCHFWGGEAADLQQACAVLDRQAGKGVDLIKVMASGGRMTRGSDPASVQFDLATLEGIVKTAEKHGLPVAAHCHGTRAIELAARAGVRTIEHCSWVGRDGWASDYQDEVARIILERGAWVSPTINRGWQRFLKDGSTPTLTRIRGAFTAMQAMGIPLVASTDAGIPGVFHQDLPLALAVFSRIAQLSPAATLRAATSEAARALGLEGITGRLAPGFEADVLIVDGDPLTDLAALSRPVGVWARGRAIRAP